MNQEMKPEELTVPSEVKFCGPRDFEDGWRFWATNGVRTVLIVKLHIQKFPHLTLWLKPSINPWSLNHDQSSLCCTVAGIDACKSLRICKGIVIEVFAISDDRLTKMKENAGKELVIDHITIPKE